MKIEFYRPIFEKKSTSIKFYENPFSGNRGKGGRKDRDVEANSRIFVIFLKGLKANFQVYNLSVCLPVCLSSMTECRALRCLCHNEREESVANRHNFMFK